ncbi:MAG: membrane protein insertion efficiency factor YidD [Candidatus Cloacimonadota bacterium]|nr:MAG: membrane protein insertion efficiency factor YidD [Candidatus Cloacimonadota bacterium]
MRSIAIFIIKSYRNIISPLFPRTCRFYPSCSSYCLLSIERYGLFRGGLRGILRILKCNPFHPGGYDPVE